MKHHFDHIKENEVNKKEIKYDLSDVCVKEFNVIYLINKYKFLILK